MADDHPLHPGRRLKEGFLDPLGITPWALAKAIGVQVGRITALIRGERSLTADTAARLGHFFQVPAVWFLEWQAQWDASAAEQDEALKAVVRPFAHLDQVIVTPRGVLPLRPVERVKPITAWMASSAHQLQAEPEGTTVVQYPHGMLALEHR